MNHLGASKLPSWEASCDRLEPKEKLKVLAEAVNCTIDLQGPTYQAFTDIFALRTALVHGRTAELEGTWPAAAHVRGATPLQTDWEKLCTAPQSARLLDEAEKLVRSLYKAAGVAEDPFGTLSGGISHGALPNQRLKLSGRGGRSKGKGLS
jgi:hypothetical protein